MSMTGYGLGEAQGNGLRVTMEMQSINRKQLEFSISLPREFESLEGALKSKCTQAFSRGRIQCRIRVTDLEGHESVRPKINASLAKACHEAFDQLAKAVVAALEQKGRQRRAPHVVGVLSQHEFAARVAQADVLGDELRHWRGRAHVAVCLERRVHRRRHDDAANIDRFGAGAVRVRSNFERLVNLWPESWPLGRRIPLDDENFNVGDAAEQNCVNKQCNCGHEALCHATGVVVVARGEASARAAAAAAQGNEGGRAPTPTAGSDSACRASSKSCGGP